MFAWTEPGSHFMVGGAALPEPARELAPQIMHMEIRDRHRRTELLPRLTGQLDMLPDSVAKDKGGRRELEPVWRMASHFK